MSDSSSECCAREREARIGCWPPLGRGDALFRARGVAPSSPSTAAGRVGAGGQQVRLARKLHMWRSAFLVPATRPTPLTSSHAQHLEHHKSHWKSRVAIIHYSRNTIVFRDGCKSRDGAGEPRVATNHHLPNIPFEGLPLPLRQRDGPG